MRLYASYLAIHLRVPPVEKLWYKSARYEETLSIMLVFKQVVRIGDLRVVNNQVNQV